jgi:hypothetical protein
MRSRGWSLPAEPPDSSVTQDLVDGYTRALDAIAELKPRKFEMPTDDYYAALEELLIQAARAHRDIRANLPTPPPPAAAGKLTLSIGARGHCSWLRLSER